MSARGRAWRLRWYLAAVLLLMAAAAAYIGIFLKIRSRAYEDFRLLQRGEWPHWMLGRPPDLVFEDGGSQGYTTFGYRLIRLHRMESWVDDDQREYRIGVRLEFSCRDWFPLLQRYLEDHERSQLEVRPW